MTEDRPLGYWETLADGGDPDDAVIESALDLLLDDRGDWTIHAVTLAGQDDDRLYLLAVRSRIGDSGLLLSLRYYVVDPMGESGHWGRDGIEMVVNGPLTQALGRSFLRADAEGLAGDQNQAPLALSSVGAEVEEDPETLVGPLAQLVEDDDADPEATVECLSCGGQVTVGEAISLDMGGNKMYRHKGGCPDE